MDHGIKLLLLSTLIIIGGAANIMNMIEKYKYERYFVFGINFMCTLLPTIVLIILWAEYIFYT